ncbi:phage regulatory CII family protein [Photobacterium sp. GJ3]|uniref:phage regulatory CII family protein n=1 Tax=Photobacterium sp. GJ3 TaxID=2829502 RepID=UPI001B8ADCCB|nr:phage regulatory CII family protein [Photobacterium sp. GJ3]QUJ67734.1 phage regulatory CII family protein [Photobacterium sp. GJ3]
MYGLPERKQKLFDDACCAFAESVVIEHVAIELGMAGQKLRNKLNPEQPAQLTCRDLIMLTDYTDDQKIINGLLLALDMVAAKRPTDANAATLASCALAASASVGELSQAAIQHQDAKWLPRDERRRLLCGRNLQFRLSQHRGSGQLKNTLKSSKVIEHDLIFLNVYL